MKTCGTTSDARRAAAAALLERYTATFSDIPRASGQDVLQLQQQQARGGRPVVLIDVRDEVERNVSMIPGAVSATDFEAMCRTDPAGVAASICIPYCTIGYRSGMYARRLLRGELLPGMPPAEVRNGEGIVMWSHDVGEFAGGARRLHCYGTAWDAAADGYATTVYSTGESVLALPAVVASWVRYSCPRLAVWLRASSSGERVKGS
eukprot:6815019-Prymnesium_polylepis.1